MRKALSTKIKLKDICDFKITNNIIIVQLGVTKQWVAGELSRIDHRLKDVEKILDLVDVWLFLPRYVTINGLR